MKTRRTIKKSTATRVKKVGRAIKKAFGTPGRRIENVMRLKEAKNEKMRRVRG